MEDQNYSNHVATSRKIELEPTVIACLAGRDAQHVLYTGFVQTLCSNIKGLRFLSDTCNADINKTPFSTKTYTVLNELLNGTICKERAEALIKTIR